MAAATTSTLFRTVLVKSTPRYPKHMVFDFIDTEGLWYDESSPSAKSTLHPQHPIKSNHTYTYRMGAMVTCLGWVALSVAPNSPLTDGVTLGNA